MERIRKFLRSSKNEFLYHCSLKSILDRLKPDGYFPESLTGAYEGMFPRTSAPLIFLLLEHGAYDKAQANLDFIFRSMEENEMERVPHVIGPSRINEKDPCFRDRDQIDGQAHVILAWARLVLAMGPNDFERKTYALIKRLTDRMSDAPYIRRAYDAKPYESALNGLVRNGCLEHSREERYWDTFDILTQTFVCAALEEMIRLAECRGDFDSAKKWQLRLSALNQAVHTLMVRSVDGMPVYLEMRLPNGDSGTPFDGFSWLNLAPVAAGWKGVDNLILKNTIVKYAEKACFVWEGFHITGMEYKPVIRKVILGKALAWELLYNFKENNLERTGELLHLLETVNPEGPYLEFAFFQPNNSWKIKDPGNGEQCVWMTWVIGLLRKAAGLPL